MSAEDIALEPLFRRLHLANAPRAWRGLADRAEKALLLQAMLAAVKIDSRLVWAADRDRDS